MPVPHGCIDTEDSPNDCRYPPGSPVRHEIGLRSLPELVEAIANFLINEDSSGLVVEDVDAGDLFADRRRMGWLWIRAYFQALAMAALRERLDTYLEELSGRFPLSEPPVLDQRIPEIQDWSPCWRRFFRPQPITSRILVRPPWDEEPVPPGMQAVTLDPGMALGTGKHPSTRLCIRALLELLTAEEGTEASRFNRIQVARNICPEDIGIEAEIDGLLETAAGRRLADLRAALQALLPSAKLALGLAESASAAIY